MTCQPLYEDNPEDYIATMACTDCGYRYELKPAVVMVDDEDRAHRYFGSNFDFCPMCDGHPREVCDE